jgi:hypothetical protein
MLRIQQGLVFDFHLCYSNYAGSVQRCGLGAALLKRTSDLLQRNGLASTLVLMRGDAATKIMDSVLNVKGSGKE